MAAGDFMTGYFIEKADPPRDTWWRVHLARAKDPATWTEAVSPR